MSRYDTKKYIWMHKVDRKAVTVQMARDPNVSNFSITRNFIAGHFDLDLCKLPLYKLRFDNVINGEYVTEYVSCVERIYIVIDKFYVINGRTNLMSVLYGARLG